MTRPTPSKPRTPHPRLRPRIGAAAFGPTTRLCPVGEGTFYCDQVPFEEVQTVALIATDSPIRCESEQPGALCDDVPLFALDQSLAGWQQVIGFDNYAQSKGTEMIVYRGKAV